MNEIKPSEQKQSKNTAINPAMDPRLRLAEQVLAIEADAIRALQTRLDQSFLHACDIIGQAQGRVVVIGMGKSGHIGHKLAATLASTGTPAFFVHPAEACHGDMGMITQQDVVLALSNSGTTDEILAILPLLQKLQIPLITLTGDPKSPLAQAANCNLDVSVTKEACPLGLAPTSSTACALAMGDALALALLDARGFTAEDFARSHPGGQLGRRLLLTVKNVMRCGERAARVPPDTTIADALIEMTQKGLGMTTVVDANNQLQGVFTDGDLRRALKEGNDIFTTLIKNAMTLNAKTIDINASVVETINLMETHKVTTLPVVNEQLHLLGIVHMHDLLQAKVI